MLFIALKTENGILRGKISFYCRMLKVTRQGFYKYQALADAMRATVAEDEWNDTYRRIRMQQALLLKQLEGIHIPGERTVYRIMEEIGRNRPKRKGSGRSL